MNEMKNADPRQEGKILRLAKPVKKGLLHLLFSRFFIVLVLLVVQLLLVLSFYLWLRQYFPYFAAFQMVFTLLMVIYLFNSGMDSTAKLTWMFIISVLPQAGAGLLLFSITNLGHRRESELVEKQIDATKHAIPQSKRVLKALQGDASGIDDLAAYLNRSGCFPIYDQTKVTFFPSGEQKFEALLRELEKAERFIFLEYFIIEEGYMWGSVLEILARKTAEGVDVRVMYDGMCEISQLPAGYTKLLEKRGIQAKIFSEIRPMVSSHHNYRDHRKILVIDGRVAFNGGVNLADEYINRVERFGHWKDTAVMLKGDAVKSFTLLFLQMWNVGDEAAVYAPFLEGEDLWETQGPAADDAPSLLDAASAHLAASRTPLDGYVIPYSDSPLDDDKVGETVYMDILYRATDYVHIMTPYLILDGELETALRYAALRGVDVRLILPGIPDKKAAYSLAKTHYRSLVDAGVKIYEYTPGFVHAKIFVSDDKKAVVGTINLDYRSLYHHFECATYLYKSACIADIEVDFQNTLKKCRKVTPETIRREKVSYKLMGRVMKFVAPLM